MKKFEKWIDELFLSTDIFLNKLRKDDHNYMFFPMEKNLTRYGEKLNLGFSCYALKIYYMLGLDEELSTKDLDSWTQYINSFQKPSDDFPKGSFIDENYLKYFSKKNYYYNYKFQIKNILNDFNFSKGSSLESYINKGVLAESKQAISTLYQVGSSNSKPYQFMDANKENIDSFLKSLNWNNPWDAGAQFANISLFTSVDSYDNDENKQILLNYIEQLASSDNGTYSMGNYQNTSQLINGSMKVITGLDWLDENPHYPNKLINQCLSVNPNSEGCDLVDYVYVLFKCSLITDYRKTDISDYFLQILKTIQLHYFDEGGFSYFKDSCQTHYYGVKFSKSSQSPDLHGTILLIWAIAMIDEFFKKKDTRFKVIKP